MINLISCDDSRIIWRVLYQEEYSDCKKILASNHTSSIDTNKA